MKSITILAGLLATSASAHMQMSKPYPIRSPLNKDSNENKDYSYTNPLQPSGSDYPCKGYANDPFQSQASYSPGQTYELELDGSATHSGGSCQLSLTYDRGKTFKVIESMLGDCPIAKKYNFQIPSDAPSGEALLAWTWFNKVGNREMYMNCAMVTIGGSGSSGNTTQSSNSKAKNSHPTQVMNDPMDDDKMDYEDMSDMYMRHMTHRSHPPMEKTTERREMTGESVAMMGQSKAAAFNSLPGIFIANVNQVGGCVTIEGESVNFPKPGDNVVGTIDGTGKGYKCTSDAPFLGSDSSSGTNAASSASSTPTSSSSTSSSTPTSTSSSNSANASSTKNNNDTSSSQKANDTSDKQKSSTTTRSTMTTSSTSQAMSMIASAFGSPSADPRVATPQGTSVASTSNAFSSYVTQWTCTSGEIICSPDGFSWAMCSNQHPIFMGNVAPGMTCRSGQMVRA